MKINKNIFICALLALMILLCINASSAEDSFDMNLTGDDSNEILTSPVDMDTIASDSGENGDDEIISQAVSDDNGGESEVLSEEDSSQGNIQITKDNFYSYFDENGNLNDSISQGSTLDFQGLFKGAYTVKINKPVNVISSTGDALFDSDSNKGNNIYSFNILAGADHTNITGLNFLNYCLYIQGASFVTVDNLNMVAKVSGVGSGTGFVSIHSNAYYTTVKNSYFENGGTGSSVLVLGKGGKYASFDNNVFNITGSSGNVVSSNIYVGTGDNPECANYTNNIIYNSMPEAATMYGMTVCGANNLIENNLIHNFKGSGIVNQFGATSTKNIYRNNVITGGASISAGTYSIIENNYLEGTLTITEGCNAVNNTAKTASISGKNAVVKNSTFNGAVTIAKAATNTSFTNNHLKEALTVNSDNNIITDNQIASTGDYAIDLKTSQNNIVKDNTLSSKDKMGDDAVKAPANKENNISSNGKNAIIQISVGNSWSGNTNNVTVTVVNATGTVTIIVNGKEFKDLPLVDGSVTYEVAANVIEVGLNDVTAVYNGSEEIAGDNKTTTFYGLDNVVFPEVFFEFFDENGMLKESVPYDDLIFKGAFTKSSTVQYIVIDRPVSIVGEGASLSLMGIVIGADDVIIDGLKLTATVNSATSALGDLISVNANNVTLTNLDINYRVTRGDYDAIAINVFDAEDVKITNNKIVFASVISSDDYSANAINLDGVSNALVDNNTVTSTLPGLLAQNYDLDYFMMGLNTVNPIRMKEVEDSVFSRNTIESSINNLGKTTPTIQCLLIVGSDNVLFDSNTFKMIDTKSKAGDATYLYAFNFGYSEGVTLLNNDFIMSTTGGKDSAGAAYALQGVESEINVTGNRIQTVSNGPNLGFYVASMMGGSSNSYIADNIFNVTGYATTGEQWALISGIEITNGDAQIYNNTIYTYNKAGYVDVAPVHGVSYGQYMYGDRSLDVQNNTMYVQGKYTVSVLDGTRCDVIGNELYAEELLGDDSVAPGYDGIVENNTPPFDSEVIVECETVWIGNSSSVTITVPGVTGNVTIKVGNRVFNELELVNGSVTQTIDAADLIGGANDIIVTYNGDRFNKVATEIANLQVLDGVITNESYQYYFDNGNLVDIVPEGTTLDFQGSFVGRYTVKINKPVNIISSTGDAVFDCGSTYGGNSVNSFNIVAGADHTNITGLKLINTCLYIQGASYVTVDDVYMKSNLRGVGSGTGFLSIHSNAYYATVKNSYMENGGTGSSVLVLGKGGKYASFDHNVINITGSSGNVLSSNIFVGAGELPQFVNYTNNVINSQVAASGFMFGITVCGEGNLIENNTLNNFKGNGIINQFGATSTKNIYRNNVITGGGSMAVGTYSLVENNNIAATVTITEGCSAIGNIVNGLTISGKNVVAKENTVNGAVTISAANITFTDNTVYGTVTVSSNGNTITDNNITSTGDYAIDLKSTKDNTVTDNRLVAKSNEGDAAVKYVDGNIVKDNYRFPAELSVSVEDILIGGTAVVNVNINGIATGNVTVIFDGKKYSLGIDKGTASMELPNLKAGQYTVGVQYDGDEKVIPSQNSTTFKVLKVKSDLIIATSEIAIGEDVNVTVTIEGASGSVDLIVDGSRKTLELNEGVAKYTIKAVSAGSHSLTAIYVGDASHEFVTNTTKFNVEKITTAIDLSDVVADYGAKIPIEFVIAEDATGKVYFTLSNEKFFETLENGGVNITLGDFAKGNYTLTASYEGDAKYAASEKTITITVNGNDAGLKANATDIKVGQNATINIEINPAATGDAVLTLDKEYTVVFVDGKATVIIPDLANGTYTATIKYDGDRQFNASEITVNFTVSKEELPSDINVTMDIPEGTTAPEFSINLPNDATGNFTVTVDGTPYTEELVNGSATVKVPELSVGNHTISSSYSGDNKYAAFESQSQNVTIPKASIPGGENAINLTSPAGTDSPTYSINLPGATGNLTVTVDGKDNYTQALANGSASVTVPALSPGDHNIVVTYSGDNKFSSISKNTTFHSPVYEIKENKDVTALYSATASYKVLITKDGKAVGAGEEVKITYNGKATTVKTDKNGYATLKLNTKVKVKTYTVTAEYKGLKVTNKVKIQHVIKASNKKVKKSKKVTKVKVTLKKVNGKYLKSKTLKIKFNKKTYKVKTNKKGVATWKFKKSILKKLKVGKKYKYKVTYGKDVVTKKLTIKK